MGRATAKFYRDVQKGNEVEALALYVRSNKELKNFNPNVFYGKCSHGNTPMHYAAKHAMRELLEKFLYVGNFPGNPEVLNAENKTCLHLICKPQSGSCSSANGGEPFSVLTYYRSLAAVNNEDKKRCEAMKVYQGEAKRRADCVELLLNWRNRNGFPTDLTLQDNQGNTALHIAAQNGLLACVKLLRLAGAPLFLENNDKKTPCDLCEKNPYLSEVAQYLESAMVFNYEKDSQKFCIEEINALKSEIFKYEIKGQARDDYDVGWTPRTNCESQASNSNSNSSSPGGSDNTSNEMSTNTSNNVTTNTTTADSAANSSSAAEQSGRCWIQSSFTRKELIALRDGILFSTASALAISEDEAELLLCKHQWQREAVLEEFNQSQSFDRFSLQSSRRCSKLSGNSINQSQSIFNFTSTSSRASSASIELPKNIAVNGTASGSSSGDSALLVSAEMHPDQKIEMGMAQKRRASATTSRKCSTSYSMPGATLISSVPQTHRLHETKLDDLGSSSNFMLPSEPLECEICFCSYDPYDSANPALPLTCNHSTCFSCLFEYIKLKIINDRKSVIECPAYKCNVLISSFQIREFITSQRRPRNQDNSQTNQDQLVQGSSTASGDDDVSSSSSSVEEVLDMLDNNVINCFVEELPDVKWCPSPDCQFAVKLPKFLSERPCVNYYYSLTANPLPGDILSLNAIINHNITEDVKPGSSKEPTAQTVSNKGPLEVLRPHSATGVPLTVKNDNQSLKSGKTKTKGGKSSESSFQVVANERLSSVSVTCSSGHYFCWYCLNEGHQPASCKHWAQWFQKIDEVKPNQMGTKDIWESAEYAANYLWFITQSKQCPKCSAPIQKADGCNHMKCGAKGCRHEFCWICLTPWSKHGSETGGFWRCNRFETEEEINQREAANRANATANSSTSASAANAITNVTTTTAARNTSTNSTSTTTNTASTTASSTLTTRANGYVTQSNINVTPIAGGLRHKISTQPTEPTRPNLSTPTLASNCTGGVTPGHEIVGLKSGKIPRSKAQAIAASAAASSSNNATSVATNNQGTTVSNGPLSSTENRATTAPTPQPRPYRALKSHRERIADLHKFLHYYSRYYNHKLSMKLELPLLDQAQEKVAALLQSFNHAGPLDDLEDKLAEIDDTDDDPANEQRRHLTFLERAIKELILTRKVLSASYVFAFYLSSSDHENIRSLFEYMQIDLEETAENLAHIVNREHLSTPWFLIEKAQLIVKKKRYDLLDATTRGVLPTDTSPIFKRKRKTFQGVQVCMDPLKMNMSERQAVMASLYEMVCHGDGWLVDSTGCHNNIPMLYGQEDYYQKTVPATPCKVPAPLVTKQKFSSSRLTSSRKSSKVSKESEPLIEYRDMKDCARKTCDRKISTPCVTPNPPKRKLGISQIFFSQRRAEKSKALAKSMRVNSIPLVSQANFCSLACMRRDKLEWLEASGFTPSGQRCTPAIPNEDSHFLSDNEFPPVFLDNERLDRERREIVKRNYELLLKEQENTPGPSKMDTSSSDCDPSASTLTCSSTLAVGGASGSSRMTSTTDNLAPNDVTGHYNNDAHLIQCCSYAEPPVHMSKDPTPCSLARS